MAKSHGAKEALHLLYQQRGSKLRGVILFFRLDQASGDKVRPQRKSHPFVIADYTEGIDRPIVYGSLVFLLTEIKRLINQFTTVNETWWRERNRMRAARRRPPCATPHRSSLPPVRKLRPQRFDSPFALRLPRPALLQGAGQSTKSAPQ